MIAMRAQLAPVLLLVLVLLASAAPLVPALAPQEITDSKINGEKNPAPASKVDAGAELIPESKSEEKVLEVKVNDEVKQMRKEAADDEKKSALEGKKRSLRMLSAELIPESKGDEKVLETKVNDEVKQMRKEAAQDDAIAMDKAKELKP